MNDAQVASSQDGLEVLSRDDFGTLRGLRNLVQLADGNFDQSVIGIGDSFGSTSLGTYFGFDNYVLIRGSYRCGQLTAGGDSLVTVHSSTNGNADYTKAPDGYYYEIASGGNLTCGHLQSGQEGMLDTAHYTFFPGTGTAQFQYSVNSGTTWTNFGSAINTSGITTVQTGDIPTALGLRANSYRIRISVTGGTVNGWIGQSTSGPGVKITQFATSGLSIGQSSTVTEAIWKAMVTGYSADLVIAAFADGRYNDVATSAWPIGADNWASNGPIDTLYQWSKTANSAVDWMIVGPHKVDPAYVNAPNATLDALYNTAGVPAQEDARIKYGSGFARQWALTNGEGFFDSYNLFPTFSEAFAHGMYLDESNDIHLSGKGRMSRLSALFDRTNLGRVFGITGQRIGDAFIGATRVYTGTAATASYLFNPSTSLALGPHLASEMRVPLDGRESEGMLFRCIAGSTATIAGWAGGIITDFFRIAGTAIEPVTTTSSGGTSNSSNGTSSRRWGDLWTAGVSKGIRAVSANTTLLSTDHTLLVDATGASRTVTLPAAAANAGREYVIKKTDATANSVQIDPNGTELLDGSSANRLITATMEALTIQSDGTSWFVVGNFSP